ncbi:MAG: chemotaxis protein CheB [Chitinophagaceae bacterium]|nr:MAG: chemotaxis protein CheB [Chitinophagaceae bacterium]
MLKRDIIVVGASAGGIGPLQQFLGGIAPGFGGTVFVVLHIAPYSRSHLAEILGKSTSLTVAEARDEAPLEPGTVYVAVSDHHLLLESGRMLVKRGPKENRFRPSIDALFRSAAYTYGPRVVGVILSGVLNDGTSGLWTVKRLGGLAIIQDPDEAEHPEMPLNARDHVAIDHCLRADEIGRLLAELPAVASTAGALVPALSAEEERLLHTEVLIAARNDAFDIGILSHGVYTPFTCPECQGALLRLQEGSILRFRCHTGHAFTASALLAAVTGSVEEKLWQAIRGLEETTLLLEGIARQFTGLGNTQAAALFAARAEATAVQARSLQEAIGRQAPISEDLRFGEESSL